MPPNTSEIRAPAHHAEEHDRPEVFDSGEKRHASVTYSAFTPTQKYGLAYAAAISATFSTLSSFIYFPAITSLAHSLDRSIEAINLTITSYLVVSGIAPSIFGDLADRLGRRPITIIALSLYFAANVGLALQNSYSALLVLRCLQSAGASCTIALAYAVVADISTPAERGTYVGIIMGFTNAAPSLGPVLGGVLTQQLSWHWIFWFLSILGGVHLLVMLIFLPETSRKLVGDGGVLSARFMNRSLYSFISPTQPVTEQSPPPFSFPNPFSCLVALFDKSNFIILVVGGLQYTLFGCLAASLSAQTISLYSLNYLTGGLLYLPSGVGGVFAAYLTGKLLNHDYRVIARRYEKPIVGAPTKRVDCPIERARLRSVFPFLILSSIATAGYGWALHAKTSLAVPLVMQFITGGTQIAIFSVCSSLLTDLNLERSATVQASYNLVRCALSAAGVGSLQALIDRVGIGWCFTIYAVIGLLGIPLFLLLRQKGEDWRVPKDSGK